MEKPVYMYLSKFNEISMFSPRDVQNEKAKISMLIGCLRPGLWDLVRPIREVTFVEVFTCSL